MSDGNGEETPAGIPLRARRTPVDYDGRVEVAAMATAFNLGSLSEADSRLLTGALATARSSLSAPIASLHFLGTERSFFDGDPRLKAEVAPFSLACTRATSHARDFIQVEDLSHHPTFGRAAPVTNSPRLRWLTTVPIRGYNELVIGAIVLLDDQPRMKLSESEEATLRSLASVIEAALESHRSSVVARAQRALLVKRLREAHTNVAASPNRRRSIHDLRNALTVIRLNSQAMEESGLYSAEAMADIRGSLILAEETTRSLKPPTPTPHPSERLIWSRVCDVQRLRIENLPQFPGRSVHVIDESPNLSGVASPACLTDVANLLVDRALDLTSEGDLLEVSLRVFPHFVRFAVTIPMPSNDDRSGPVEPLLLHPARNALIAIGGSVRTETIGMHHQLSAWFPLDEEATYIF